LNTCTKYSPIILYFFALNTLLFLISLFNTKFNIQGWYQQLVSWIVAAALAAGAWGLNFVSLGTPTWLSLIAFMAVCGLSSNGVYDVPAIKALIEKWFSLGELLSKK
jgi:hypothetical protein